MTKKKLRKILEKEFEHFDKRCLECMDKGDMETARWFNGRAAQILVCLRLIKQLK